MLHQVQWQKLFCVEGHPADPNGQTQNPWKLRVVHADAEIALQVENEDGETISIINDPRGCYGARQTGFQAVIDTGLTLDAQTLFTNTS